MSERGGLRGHADFVRLWSAQAISAFGSRITRTALPIIAVVTLGVPEAMLGVLGALQLAPGVILAVFAGALVDRDRKRRILIAADLVRAAAVASLTIAWAFGTLSMLHIILVGAVVGGASALFQITDVAYLPVLIGKSHLAEGNAKLEATEAVAEITGPASAGVLIAALGAPLAVALDAASYVWSAVMLGRIRAVEPATRSPGSARDERTPDVGRGAAANAGNPAVVRGDATTHDGDVAGERGGATSTSDGDLANPAMGANGDLANPAMGVSDGMPHERGAAASANNGALGHERGAATSANDGALGHERGAATSADATGSSSDIAVPIANGLRVGLRAVFGHRLVRPVVLAHMVWAISGGFFMSLYTLFLLRELGLSEATFGLIIAMGGIGSLFGALLSRALTRAIGLGPALLSTATLSLAGQLLIPLASGSHARQLGCLFAHQLISDGFSVAWVIQAVTLRQTVLPRELLGRANAAIYVCTAGLVPIAALAAGGLAEAIGIRDAVWVGVLLGLAAPLMLLPLRKLHALPHAA